MEQEDTLHTGFLTQTECNDFSDYEVSSTPWNGNIADDMSMPYGFYYSHKNKGLNSTV